MHLLLALPALAALVVALPLVLAAFRHPAPKGVALPHGKGRLRLLGEDDDD